MIAMAKIKEQYTLKVSENLICIDFGKNGVNQLGMVNELKTTWLHLSV
ncbi:unnamed protein product [Arabidopsis halleri]